MSCISLSSCLGLRRRARFGRWSTLHGIAAVIVPGRSQLSPFLPRVVCVRMSFLCPQRRHSRMGPATFHLPWAGTQSSEVRFVPTPLQVLNMQNHSPFKHKRCCMESHSLEGNLRSLRPPELDTAIITTGDSVQRCAPGDRGGPSSPKNPGQHSGAMLSAWLMQSQGQG
jgi:hypothetical protein